MHPRFAALPVLLCASAPALGQGSPQVIARIIEEGKQNSHVWETLTYLAEEIGPRLTGSTNLARASAWTRDEFARLGLDDVHLHRWGELPVRFDRGPCRARVVAPLQRELEFTARSWSAGTDGPLRARVVLEPETLEGLEAIEGELDGSWVLGKSRRRSRRGRGGDAEQDADAAAKRELREKIAATIDAADIAGRLTASRNDLVITGGERGWRELTMDTLPTDVNVTIRRSDYEAIAELIEAGEEVEVEVDLVHHFSEGPFPIFNTVAEIPGSEWPEQVVILSAHLDSWDGPGSQGAQDNGTGSSVMLEAARILMAAGAEPKRTIRFCLWTGEEQGLYGSRKFVEDLSDEEKALISAAFVDDGGTNFEGGLVCIEPMSEMLDRAIAPLVEAFPEYEVLNVVRERMPRGGGSDHASFNRAGIPGFFWIEKGSGGREEKSYGFIHHTQHDTTRYAVEEYLIQSATCSAVTAYNLAMADTLLPREDPEAVAEAPAPDPTFEVVSGPLSGTWEARLTGEEAPDMTFSLRFEHAEDGRLRGALVSPMGEAPIVEGSFDAEARTMRLVADSDMGRLSLEGSLGEGEQPTIEGSLEMGEGAMQTTFRATRPPVVETPISGTWEGYIEEMDSTFLVTLAVAADGALSGRFKSSQSDSELFDGRWDAQAGTLSFEYDYPHAGRLEVQAKLEGERLVGTLGGRVQFVAKRLAGDQ